MDYRGLKSLRVSGPKIKITAEFGGTPSPIQKAKCLILILSAFLSQFHLFLVGALLVSPPSKSGGQFGFVTVDDLDLLRMLTWIC